MANEFRSTKYNSGLGAGGYGLLFNGAGQVWNGSAFVSIIVANWAAYIRTITEQSTSGYYYADMLAGQPLGLYYFDFMIQAGGSPAGTDTSFSRASIDWKGAALGEATIAGAPADVDAVMVASHGAGSYVRNTEPPTTGAIAAAVDITLSASHGGGGWVTAVGFAAPGAQMGLVDGAITDNKIAAPAEAAGQPAGILGMIRRIFERGRNKRTRDRATGAFVLRNVADTGNLESNTQSTAGTVDTISTTA